MDGVGLSDAWAALTRGRLRHLESLGLAVRSRRRYRLDLEMETKLRTLQARRDIIRTLNQRRLDGSRDVRLIATEKVRGVVVKTGFHDEVGAAPWVIVRDERSIEHFARLRAGHPSLVVGAGVTLAPLPNGFAQILPSRQPHFDRGMG